MGARVDSAEMISFELVAEDLSFPTSITFGDRGKLYVAESGLPWGGATPGGRIWKVDSIGERELVAEGLRYPVNGVTWHEGALYVSEGGHPGRISRILTNGVRETILDNLPGPGNYHTNMVVFGPDGKLYFSQGAMSNTGIIGLDAYELGWLRRLPHQHDLPGFDIELTGHNTTTPNPLADVENAQASTGAFVPFGTETEPGQRISAQLPCTAAVMRCNADGTELELVAWGLRNAYGLGFLPDGRLLAIDQGSDDRGSRPVGAAPDLLFHVRDGAWYGWPDFIGGEPITAPKFRPFQGPPPAFVLANHPELPSPEPALVRFPAHSAATKFAIAPDDHPLWPGDLVVTLFGDEIPMTAPEGPRIGHCLMRIDPQEWTLHPIPTPPLARPIDVRFSPEDGALYVLDFGFFEMGGSEGLQATSRSGRILRLAF